MLTFLNRRMVDHLVVSHQAPLGCSWDDFVFFKYYYLMFLLSLIFPAINITSAL